RHGTNALLVASPVGLEAVAVGGVGSVRIGVVPQHEHGPRDRVERAGGGLVVRLLTAPDVPGADENLWGAGILHERGERVGTGAAPGIGGAHPHQVAPEGP